MNLSSLRIQLVFFALLLSSAANATERTRYCNLALLGNYRLSEYGLRWAPGPSISYPTRSLFARNSYFDRIYITISSETEIDRMAHILGQGNNQERRRIGEGIRRQTRTPSGRYEGVVDLNDLLPGGLSRLAGTRAACEGTNCYNTALAFHIPGLELRHTTAEEMIGHLRSLHYEQLAPGERMEIGDLLAIWVPNSQGTISLDEPTDSLSVRLLHAAVYLDDDLIFHKASSAQADPYAFERLSGVIQRFAEWQPVITVHRFTMNRFDSSHRPQLHQSGSHQRNRQQEAFRLHGANNTNRPPNPEARIIGLTPEPERNIELVPAHPAPREDIRIIP